MKNIVSLLLPVIIFTHIASAQPVTIGVRGGLSVPNIAPGGAHTPVSEGYKSRMATGAGIFTEMEFNKLFSLRLGIEYSGQGGKKDGIQAMPSERVLTGMASNIAGIDESMMSIITAMSKEMPQYVYADIKNRTKFDYLMIPVLAQFGWNLNANSPWRVYVNAGPFLSFLMGGKQVSSGTDMLYLDDTKTTSVWNRLSPSLQEDVKEHLPDVATALQTPFEFGSMDITGELKPVNFGFTGNLGLSYQHKRNRFFVEVGGNYGLIRVQKNTENGSNRIGAGTIMLGYSFNLIQ